MSDRAFWNSQYYRQSIYCSDKSYFRNSSPGQKVINAINPISIPTWYWLLGHLSYLKILRLPKVADGIDVKKLIPGEIFGDYIERKP